MGHAADCVDRKRDGEGQTVNNVWNKIRRRMQGPLKARCSAAVFISVEKTPRVHFIGEGKERWTGLRYGYR